MSSRAKKDKVSAAAAAPEVPPEKEVVPGKVTEAQWLEWMREEEASEVAGEIVKGLVDLAYYLARDRHLEEEAFAHTVKTAKASLLQIIEWEFLQRDEGEKDAVTNPTWREDPEPWCSVIDSWACGIVPEISEEEEDPTLSSSSCSIEELPLLQPNTNEVSLEYTTRNTSATDDALPLREQDRRLTRVSTVSSSTHTTATTSRHYTVRTPPPKATRTRPQARRPQARLLALTRPQIEDDPVITSPHEREQVPPSPAHSYTPTSSPLPPSSSSSSSNPPPPLPYNMKPAQLRWQKDVTYDSSGKIMDMLKLNPSSFPSHRVRPRVTISDPSPLKSITKQQPHTSSLKYHGNSSGSRKQGATGRREMGGVTRRIRGRDGVEPSSSGGAVTGDSKRTVKSVTRNRFPDTLTLPALVDTIDLSTGVRIIEGDRSAGGPYSPRRPPHFLLPNTTMHPVTLPPPPPPSSSFTSPPLSTVSAGHTR